MGARQGPDAVVPRTTQGPARPVPKERWLWDLEVLHPKCLPIFPCLFEVRHAGDGFAPCLRDEGRRFSSYTIHVPHFFLALVAAPPPPSALKLKGRADPGGEVLLGEALDCFGSMKGGSVWKVRRSERPGQEAAPWAPMQACFWLPLPSFSAFLRD